MNRQRRLKGPVSWICALRAILTVQSLNTNSLHSLSFIRRHKEKEKRSSPDGSENESRNLCETAFYLSQSWPTINKRQIRDRVGQEWKTRDAKRRFLFLIHWNGRTRDWSASPNSMNKRKRTVSCASMRARIKFLSSFFFLVTLARICSLTLTVTCYSWHVMSSPPHTFTYVVLGGEWQLVPE